MTISGKQSVLRAHTIGPSFFPGWYLSNTIQSDILTLWFYINTVILHFQVVIMLLSKWESDCEWRKQCLTLSSRSYVCSFIMCLLSSCFKVFGYLIFNFPSRKMCACVLCCFKWSPHKKSIQKNHHLQNNSLDSKLTSTFDTKLYLFSHIASLYP